MAETIGAIQVVATINTKDYDAAKSKIEKNNSELEDDASKTSKGFSSVWIGAIAGVAASLTHTFLNAVTGSIGDAVKRVDTLNNASRTFDNMGISTKDSSAALNALQKSIKGLPTPLDAAVRGMTSLTATYQDIGLGQKVFTALNDAILGFGGTADMVDNAITQLSQLPMDGPLDAQTWNSLRNSGITPVLTAMAKDSGMSVAQMKAAFGDGTLTVQDFTKELLKLDKNGGGGLVSLQKIAKDSTSGIGTGFDNMRTAIVRGVGEIIKSVGSKTISDSITKIGNAFETTLDSISSTVKFIEKNKDIFTTLAVSISAAGVSLLVWTGYVKAAALYTSAYTFATGLLNEFLAQQALGAGVLEAAWTALNATMKANPIGIIITLVAALVAGLIWFFTQTQLGKDIIKNVGDFIADVFTNIKNAISTAFNWVKDNWPLLLAILTGPIGIAVFEIVKNWDAIKTGAANLVNSIKGFFQGLPGWFASVWNNIVNTFVSAGVKVGSAIGDAVRGAINGILRGAVDLINDFIKSINIAIDVINHIPGVKMGKLGTLPVPQLANGGIVTQPTLAMIGEGRDNEAVIPLPKLDEMLNNSSNKSALPPINVTINARTIDSRNDLRDIARETIGAYNEIIVSKGLKPLPM